MKLSKEFIAMFREGAKKAQWEINCWNGKSIDDLVVDYLEHKELNPEDFTGAVVLSIEEAKAVLECVDACAFPSPFEGFVSKIILLQDKLKKRIKKTEMQDEIK